MKGKKSYFDLSHTKAMTCGYDGKLYPILCEAVLPGDVWRGRSDILGRVTPLVQPIYGRFDIRTDFFFVPNRLVWDNWQRFISPDFDQITSSDIVFPCFQPSNVSTGNKVDINLLNEGTLADYLGCCFPSGGLAPTSNSEIRISALPFRAISLVWNEFYRDQDLQSEIHIRKGDGFNFADDFSLLDFRRANWEKDYFTTARPWAQKGGQSTIPVNIQGVLDNGGNPLESTSPLYFEDGEMMVDGIPVNATSAFTIEDLRYANSLQRFLEKLSRNGSRYIETIKSFFGVATPDYRLQRPEFIGGGRQPLVISEVLQTNNTPTDETPLGTYAGHGISSGSHNFSYRSTEHGYIIGLMRIVPRTSYMNVMRRDFLKYDKFDFFWPQFAHLGEQSILKTELNANMAFLNKGVDEFGYQERYAEYKFIPSTVHANFRKDAILSNFTPARNIGGIDQVLNGDFVSMLNTGGFQRVFAIEAYDPFLVSIMHNISALRPVPRNSIPGSHYL